MTREPNTQYVLSLSYGKDSLACLEAIRILGLPLDRIVHAEVWATDTIPADLPPMVEFKKKADEIILKRYGIVVEHICAVERERERETDSHSRDSSTPLGSTRKSEENVSTDFQWSEALGATPNSNSQLSNELRKLTFEKLFYHIPKRRAAERERERVQSRDSRANGTCIATDSNPERYWIRYGFPRPRMPFCNTLLKAKILDRYIRIPRISQPGELVYSTQTEGFPLAPLSRGQR